MNASWVSQRVPAMGAIKGEGIKQQLGRPDMDRLTLLVREAAQNSWDARDPAYAGIPRFELALNRLERSTADAWRESLGENAPEEDHLPLRSALRSPRQSVLFVGDRGTTGLGGPTRGDRERAGEPHDYLSFVLNVGDPRDTALGGGTYGFGKAILYLASVASTIIVYTRCRDESGRIETRLVGCALGSRFEALGRAYTGRHWFGFHDAADADGQAVEPLRDDDAERLASRLGFPPFDGELGTTIGVIGPKLDGRSPEAAADRLANSVLWHLWPKMVPRGGAPPAMAFAVSLDGHQVEVPDPVQHPVLREFVAALDSLEKGGSTITHGQARTEVGRMNLRTTFAPPPIVDEVGEEALRDVGVHHCCLLRSPELVVNYRAGPTLPDERVWYAGAFRVHDAQDAVFAPSEPPSHDEWVATELEQPGRSIVSVTLRKIDEALRSHAAPAQVGEQDGGSSEGLAAISRRLGSLLAPAPGEGAGPKGSRGGGGGSRASVRTVGDPRWVQHDGSSALSQEFEVTGRSTVTVEADLAVRVWGGGGRETEPPQGASAPRLLAWVGPDGSVHAGERVAVGGDEAGRWQAIVDPPPDTVTRIRIREATRGEDGG